MNVNEVIHSEHLKSNIKVDADGKWFSLSLIVLLIVVIVDNYNEPILTASRQAIHWIVDKQEWYTNNFILPQNGARYFSVYGFWHLRDKKYQFPGIQFVAENFTPVQCRNCSLPSVSFHCHHSIIRNWTHFRTEKCNYTLSIFILLLKKSATASSLSVLRERIDVHTAQCSAVGKVFWSAQLLVRCCGDQYFFH